VKNLRTRFGATTSAITAVNGISYDLRNGESLGIVGESGSGKSVSVLSLLKLLPMPPAVVSADSILFDGREIGGFAPEELDSVRGGQIGMIFQDPTASLNPVLTVGHQIEESLVAHRGLSKAEARSEAVRLLSEVGIAEAAQRCREYPFQFSGGMRQRAMIAIAISCRPRLLIADEPTTALDVTIQAQILDIIRTLTRERGMGLILITHSFAVVSSLCDRILVMYAGRVVEEAPASRAFSRPMHPYTKALLLCMPRVDADVEGELPSIPGSPPDLSELGLACPFVDRCATPCAKGREALPPLFQVEPDHTVRCWLYE
jgi:oligopeptide/dipeptide ABC transporter ATP-binding protein